MAIQVIPLTLTAQSSQTFTFTKPTGAYKKDGGIPTLTAAPFGGVGVWYTADVDNGNGTYTGQINYSAAITGNAVVTIMDTPS